MQKISVLSQKGGVGKSSLTSMLAVEYARVGWKVLIADMDVSQGSLLEWSTRRQEAQLKPNFDIGTFESIDDAIKDGNHDIVFFDGAPHASQLTKELASISDLIILPTGCSLMDLNPQVRLAHELVAEKVDPRKILFIVNKTGNSSVENKEVLDFLKKTSYKICTYFIPEKTIFRRLFNEGKTLSEVRFPKLKEACDKVVQVVVDRINQLTN